MARPVGSKNRPGSKKPGKPAGFKRDPIARTCLKCGEPYMGFNGTRYCSDRCVLLAHVAVQGDGCWHFTGYTPASRGGYGEFDFKSGKRMLAHRAAYLLLKGDDPGKQLVCHRCDVPRCVNPDHLFLGSIQDNMDDRNAKGRQARGERNGPAKLTEEQVRAIRADQRLHREIAADYGVADHTISAIKNRKTWKHI